MGIARRIADFYARARRAREQVGKPVWRQTWEAGFLCCGPAKLGISDYHHLRVFDPAHDAAARARFCGYRVETLLDDRMNYRNARMVATDKLVFRTLASQAGLPLPALQAVYSGCGAYAAIEASLPHAGALRELISAREAPVFVKPIRGGSGDGAFAVQGFDPRADAAILLDGRRVAMTELEDLAAIPRYRGLLVEEMLRPDPAFFAAPAGGVATVRLIVVLTDGAPVIETATLRMPVGGNLIDNFDRGSKGNLVAALDLEGGRIKRAVRSSGLDLESLSYHPDTTESMIGTTVPQFEEIRRICKKGARLFPDLRLQHWDIALTDKGPVILELNVEGGLYLHQIAHGRGVLEGRIGTAWRQLNGHAG
jgi:hypothetical protein